MHVFRKDAKELLAIEDGEWSLEKIKSEAERLFALSEEAFIRSNLPAKSDHEKISKLCVEIADLHNEWWLMSYRRSRIE